VRFKRQRSGYPMRCKPPWMSSATAWLRVFPAEPQPPRGRLERTRNLVGHGLTAYHSTKGQLRRNVVGVHGVKLDAAPDTPPWGRCSPVCRQLRSATSGRLWLSETFTHPRTATPARRGRCAADLRGAQRGQDVPSSGLPWPASFSADAIASSGASCGTGCERVLRTDNRTGGRA
jgi:hypothetical protein